MGILRYFYTRNEYREEFLSLVLEWMPTSVDRLLREHEKHPERIPLPLVQRAFQQFAKALQYLHESGVCHRDIKPHNLLLDPTTGMVKLCDFGCSKRLNRGEANIQYICARYYRAPEIVLGWANYSTAIDLWSAGCVLGELLTGRPIFPGKNTIDQLAKIIRVLGAPTFEEMISMGQEPKRLGLKTPLNPQERWQALRSLVYKDIPDGAVSLLTGLLQYNPEARLKPIEILNHPFLVDIPTLSKVPPSSSSTTSTPSKVVAVTKIRSSSTVIS